MNDPYLYLGIVPASTSLLSRDEASRSLQWSYLFENKIFSNQFEEKTTTTPKPTVAISIKPARLIGSLRSIFKTLPMFNKETIEKSRQSVQKNEIYVPKKFKIYEAVPTTN